LNNYTLLYGSADVHIYDTSALLQKGACLPLMSEPVIRHLPCRHHLASHLETLWHCCSVVQQACLWWT